MRQENYNKYFKVLSEMLKLFKFNLGRITKMFQCTVCGYSKQIIILINSNNFQLPFGAVIA